MAIPFTLSTKSKIRLARIASTALMAIRNLFGLGSRTRVARRGLNWVVDLNEGFDFAIYLTGAFEPKTIASYNKILTPGDIAVDIGANIGAHTLHLAKAVGPGGRVFAIEPAFEVYLKLKENIRVNPDIADRINAFQLMLMDDDNVVVPEKVYASWPLMASASAHPLHQGVPVTTEGAIARKLDTLVLNEGIDRVDIIKLDVDGYELDVLSGAQKTLEKYKPVIIFEYSPYTLIERNIDGNAIINLLVEHGYWFHNLSGRRYSANGFEVPKPAEGSSINILAIHPENIRQSQLR